MNIARAYRLCREEAAAHYENFPVASILLPRRLRDPVAAIYVFARRADDLADEGSDPAEVRLARLDAMADGLQRAHGGAPPADPLWHALADAMARFQLPADHFEDLLAAFRQDVACHRYADFEELLAYCERSANPVGRLLLQLAGAADAPNLRAADSICTALQLINFLQDLHQDFVERDRLYIPARDLHRHGVSEEELRAGQATPGVQTLLGEQIERAAWWLHEGADLPARLSGRFAAEIRLIIRGGWRIVERLRREKPADPFARPRLNAADRRWILRGLLARRALPRSIPAPADPVRTRLYSINADGQVRG